MGAKAVACACTIGWAPTRFGKQNVADFVLPWKGDKKRLSSLLDVAELLARKLCWHILILVWMMLPQDMIDWFTFDLVPPVLSCCCHDSVSVTWDSYSASFLYAPQTMKCQTDLRTEFQTSAFQYSQNKALLKSFQGNWILKPDLWHAKHVRRTLTYQKMFPPYLHSRVQRSTIWHWRVNWLCRSCQLQHQGLQGLPPSQFDRGPRSHVLAAWICGSKALFTSSRVAVQGRPNLVEEMSWMTVYVYKCLLIHNIEMTVNAQTITICHDMCFDLHQKFPKLLSVAFVLVEPSCLRFALWRLWIVLFGLLFPPKCFIKMCFLNAFRVPPFT